MRKSEQPPVWRVLVTILIGLGWLVFLGLWLFFYASEFSLSQNIAIFLLSIAIVGGIISFLWVPWGMKHSD